MTNATRPTGCVRALRLWRPLSVAPMLGLGACQGVLDPQGPIARAQAVILLNATIIMLAIIVPTIVATLAFAWWFRASNGRAVYRPDWAYSGRVELLVWSIPLLTIMFLGGIAWVGSHDLDPYRPIASDKPPLRVQVVALDWKWLFVYPDENVASVNEFVIEADRPVAMSLTSASVMNAFFVPQLGSMIYTMNGMTSQLHLQADGTGEYEGLSSNLSGDGFAGMRFKARSLATGDFAKWVESARAADQTLDRDRYTELAKQSAYVKPVLFRAVAPNLFEGIVSQAIPPGPGPDAGRGGPEVSPGGRADICTPTRPRGADASPALSPTTRG